MNRYIGFPDWVEPARPEEESGEGTAPPEQPQAAQPRAGGMLAGLAAYGVPVGYTPNGTPMVMAGMSNQQMLLPPNLPGMPPFPAPPAFLFDGGAGGGLLQPLAPVRPFDPRNQVQMLKAQDRARAAAQPGGWPTGAGPWRLP